MKKLSMQIATAMFVVALSASPRASFAQDAEADEKKPAEAETATPDPASQFDRLDKDGDGFVVESEITDEQRRFLRRMMRVGDTNDDNKLSKEEFIAASQEDEPDSPRGRRPIVDRARGMFTPEQLFDRFDADGDGKLTKKEFPEPMQERVGRLLDRLDQDSLSKEDMERVGQFLQPRPFGGGEFLRRLDANNDGKVSRDEIPAPVRERLEPIFDKANLEEIDIERFAELMRDLRPANEGRLNPSQQRPRGAGPPILPALDTDRDGAVSREEFEALDFDELDRNEDGKLQPSELFGRPPGDRPEMRRRPQGDDDLGDQADPFEADDSKEDDAQDSVDKATENFLSRLDADDNGEVTKDELPDGLQQRFDRIDRNENGLLDADEVRPRFERHLENDGSDS